MRCKLIKQSDYLSWYRSNKNTPIFNDDDEYVFFEEFGWEITRDQIRGLIKDYQATLDIKQEKE